MSGSKLSDATTLPAAPKPELEPIGLTVHRLPEPEAAVLAAQRTRRGRWQMLLVLLACAAPVIASYFTYYVIRPEGRRNFGELIDPQHPMPDMPGLDLEGRTHKLTELKGQWLLVSVGSGSCNELCVQQLYFQRQLRESLGKERDRLDRVWLVSDMQAIPAEMQPGLQDATVLRVPAEELARWLAPAPGHEMGEHLYVVDPMGNWMMRFPARLDVETAAKAKRDLERLLRASSAWDQAGR